MKRKAWGGYWYWDDNKETIMIQCRPQDADAGDLLDIRDTKRVEYTLMHTQATDWEIANNENCPMLGGESIFSFEDAIKYLKRGLKVTRKGWNEKKIYLKLVENSKTTIALVYPNGTQIDWTPSVEDILAEDWLFYTEWRKING